jgi:putative transcription antitermination factor YqgF
MLQKILAIDRGSKRIGLAVSIQGIIQPLTVIKNDSHFLDQLNQIISDYKIDKIFVGISEGLFALKTKKFVDELRNMVTLPIETVEEAVSTIEASEIFVQNNRKKKRSTRLFLKW